ncbi:MAG TPA: hypothetical protein PLU80_20155, partial [Acidobacteriota bacterium]|nr:hypothetical protein [Acidobacteriota bacterium]
MSLPLDSTVQSVSVTFENPLSLGSINIPAYIQPIPIPLPDGSGPVGGEYVNCPSDAGDFKQEFSFRVSNDVTAKRVGVWFRPVNFVPSTKSLTLYTTVKINIVYSTSSSAALLSFSPGSREVLVSSPINTQTSIENTSQTTQLFQSEIRLLDYRDQLIRSYVGKETVASGQKVDIAVSFIGPSSPGLYTLEVLAKDSQGMIQGRNQEYIRVVDRDTTAPTVKVLSPNGGNALKSGFPIPVTWTATDNQRIVSQEVRLSVDGGVNYPFVFGAGLPGGITKTEI